ncbi:hypothetical protein T552_03267 [Pneumocystis carinii B80]|uniref:Uncharacterized protein n=1 Tax=Pneumocystis carinii (strain B80) TaxID=1408658 RepID=A0A0W4ZC61_PNEC8|nr:hypothetical protein T552_03267 [Pneumocystis carinii B80]KTW25995.1 hypothetical protein T552_03267 [Pneumocystis carinii B80]
MSLNSSNDLDPILKRPRFLKKRQPSIKPIIKEVTITMTHWITHHDCIILSTIDSSRINTKSDTREYVTITGTRDI